MKHKIQLNYISDIHLEFLINQYGLNSENQENLKYIRDLFKSHKQDNVEKHILLICGDLVLAKHLHYFIPFLEEIITTEQFDHVYYVKGNHESYYKLIDKSHELIKEQLQKSQILSQKVSLLENELVSITPNLKLFGCSYWYTTEPEDKNRVIQRLNDFIKIKSKHKNHYIRLQYNEIVLRHYESQHLIKNIINNLNDDEQLVLLTHHATSERLPYKSKSDLLGYATQLNWDTLENVQQKVLAAFHGHYHIQNNHKYINEFGIPTYSNTIGYIDDEFQPNSESGIIQRQKGLPFILL